MSDHTVRWSLVRSVVFYISIGVMNTSTCTQGWQWVQDLTRIRGSVSIFMDLGPKKLDPSDPGRIRIRLNFTGPDPDLRKIPRPGPADLEDPFYYLFFLYQKNLLKYPQLNQNSSQYCQSATSSRTQFLKSIQSSASLITLDTASHSQDSTLDSQRQAHILLLTATGPPRQIFSPLLTGGWSGGFEGNKP